MVEFAVGWGLWLQRLNLSRDRLIDWDEISIDQFRTEFGRRFRELSIDSGWGAQVAEELAVLNFVASSLRRDGDLAVGEIWLHLAQVPFPSQGWRDLVIPVLAALTDGCLAVAQGDPGPHEVHFMRGPYLLELEAQGTNLKVRALRTDRNLGFVASAVTEWGVFARQVLGVAVEALLASEDADTTTLDDQRLAASVKRLRQAISAA